MKQSVMRLVCIAASAVWCGYDIVRLQFPKTFDHPMDAFFVPLLAWVVGSYAMAHRWKVFEPKREYWFEYALCILLCMAPFLCAGYLLLASP